MHFGPEDDAGVSSPNTTQTTPSHSLAVELARRFHDAYERLAPQFGYITREDTRAFDPESSNGKLMTAVCAELTSQQEVAAPVRESVEFYMACLGAELEGIESADKNNCLKAAIGAFKELDSALAASRVPVASLASREQGVEAVGAVPVGKGLSVEDALRCGICGRSGFHYHSNHDGELKTSVMPVVARIWGEQGLTVTEHGTAPPSSKAQDDLAGAESGRVPMRSIERFNACIGDEIDPVERLRFFCSIAMSGQDWMDVEPFFDALASQPKAPAPVPVVQGEAPLSDDEQHELWMQITGGDIEGWESAREFARRLHATPPMAVGADRVLTWRSGGCRPALHTEITLWDALAALSQPAAQVVDCEDCGGRGKVGEPYGGSEFQPPECDPCESCGGSGKWNLEPAADQSSVIAILKEQLNACAASLKSYQESDDLAAQGDGGECGGVQVHTTHKNVKTWPGRIWLQGNPDDDEPAPYSETWDNDTTWCADHIGESDIEYIRADLSGGRAS